MQALCIDGPACGAIVPVRQKESRVVVHSWTDDEHLKTPYVWRGTHPGGLRILEQEEDRES